jgi:hypothetical protein
MKSIDMLGIGGIECGEGRGWEGRSRAGGREEMRKWKMLSGIGK